MKREPQLRHLSRRPPARQLRLELLEDRTLMSVDVGTAFNGIAYTGIYPPDPNSAASYDYVVEVVNSKIAYYDKAGNQLSNQSLSFIFSPLGGLKSLGDPVVLFDQLTGQFVMGVLDYSTSGTFQSRFDFAVSNDENPFDGWTVAGYDMNDGVGGNEFADYPKMGYNADGWFAGFNMFLNGNSFNHVDTLAISKADFSGTRSIVSGGSVNFTLAPASIMDANPGDPEWLVERTSASASSLKLFQITNVSDPPVQVATVSVPAYSTPPKAKQLGGTNQVDTIDDRIMNATMLGGQLLTDHTVSSGGIARARWYQIDTTTDTPSLYQWGEVNDGDSTYTYMPAIGMNYNGDIGIAFMESSTTEYVSMGVTGQSVNDSGSGTLQPAVITHPGTSYYTLSRAGDYSGLAVDPSDGYTFWGTSEYKGSSTWNTGIAGFGVSPQSAPVTHGPAARARTAALGTAFQAAQRPINPVPDTAAVHVVTADPVVATVAPAESTPAGLVVVPAVPMTADDSSFGLFADNKGLEWIS